MFNQQEYYKKNKSSIRPTKVKLKNSIGRAIRRNPATAELTITIQSGSTNLIKQQSEKQVRQRKTNQIIIEQPKDAVLQQLKAKLLHEDYSESILQQDARSCHYSNN